MEELISRYPDEFFPRKKLTLKDRQRNFPGVGRFDLMFLDEFDSKILMELKARTTKYEDASQLAKYLDAMNAVGEKNIIMWLVAPQIPNSVREFLDRIGIEYSEIHIAEYKRIAKKYDYSFQSATSIIEKDSNISQFTKSQLNRNVSKPFASSYNSIIQSKYRTKRDYLQNTFEEAYNFLCRVERNNDDIWLGTSTNAHLYIRNNYLFYIIIEAESLMFRARFNNQIYSGTIDNSKIIFSNKFQEMILNLNGFNNGWASKRGDKFVLKNNTPEEFFERLYKYILSLKFE